MDILVTNLVTDCFYKIGNYYVLLTSVCPDTVTVVPSPDLNLGWVQINLLRLGAEGIPIGYAIEATGKVKWGTHFLLAARKSSSRASIKELARNKDYPELRYKLPGIKVLTSSNMVTILAAKPLSITEHLENP